MLSAEYWREEEKWVAPKFRGFSSWLLLPAWPQCPGSPKPVQSDSDKSWEAPGVLAMGHRAQAARPL